MERRKRVIGWPERVSGADPETYIAATDNIGALGELINLSGKMRMLSHRAILFVALERFENPEFISSHAKQINALDRLCAIYSLFLPRADPRKIAPEVTELMAAGEVLPPERQKKIEEFIFMVRSVRKDAASFSITDLCVYLDEVMIRELEKLIAGVKQVLENEIERELEAGRRTARTVNKTLVMIEDLAQTVRMISVNASIESKRVGLAGAGFDVIAKEIQHISERSGEAARKIRNDLG